MTGAPNRARGGQQGFTVVEVLITLAVTLIGLAALVGLHRVITRGNSSAARSAEASAVAEAALEEVRHLTFAELEGRFGAAPIDLDLEDAAGAAERVYGRHLRVEALSAVSPDLFRVRVEVTWTEDGAAAGSDDGAHDHALVLETFRTRREAL